MAGAIHHATHLAVRTANDRLKDAFAPLVWGSIAVSAAAHFAVISSATFDGTGDYGIHSGPELTQVEIQREFEVPPPPEQIARPAVPVLSANMNISEDITIAAVTFEENPVEMLPPAPNHSVENTSLADQPTFTPYEVKPELKNPGEMQKLMQRNYPSIFRDAGIGGKVVLWVYIDENGTVKNTRVVSSTGYPELDAVAEGLLRDEARFTPAYNRDERVPVWIQIPVEFATRGGTSE